MAAVPVDIIAGSIITPGFVEPAAALIDNTVDGTNWIHAAFNTKNNAISLLALPFSLFNLSISSIAFGVE